MRNKTSNAHFDNYFNRCGEKLAKVTMESLEAGGGKLVELHGKLIKSGQNDLAVEVLLKIFDQAQQGVSTRVRRAR